MKSNHQEPNDELDMVYKGWKQQGCLLGFYKKENDGLALSLRREIQDTFFEGSLTYKVCNIDKLFCFLISSLQKAGNNT